MIKKVLIALLLFCSSAFSDELAIKDGKLIKVDSVVNPIITFVKPDKIKQGLIIVKANLQDYLNDSTSSVNYEWSVKEDGQDAVFIISKDDNVIALGGSDETKLIEIRVDVNIIYKLEEEDFTMKIHNETSIKADEQPAPNPLNTVHANFMYETLNKSISDRPQVNKSIVIDIAHKQAKNFQTIANSAYNLNNGETIKQTLVNIYKLNNDIIKQYNDQVIIDLWTDVGNKTSDYLYNIYINNNNSISKKELADIFTDFSKALEFIK